MDPSTFCIEPGKPLAQVRDSQEGMSEVLPSEHKLDLLSIWLTGTMTAVSSPDVIVGGIPPCVSFSGIQLVWHLVEPAKREASQPPLDVKPEIGLQHQALQPFSV